MSRGRGDPEARWPLLLVSGLLVTSALAALAAHRGSRNPTTIATRSIDLDRADVVDLDLLPGIGPALASRIVADRATHGPFGSPEALVRVRGVGPATVEAIRPFVRGGGTPDRDDG